MLKNIISRWFGIEHIYGNEISSMIDGIFEYLEVWNINFKHDITVQKGDPCLRRRFRPRKD